MLLTWKLWRILRDPPPFRQAVYQRIILMESWHLHILRFKPSDRLIFLFVFPLLLYAIYRFGFVGILIIFFGIPSLILLAALLIPLLLPFLVTILGGVWAATISLAIVKERQSHTYDLLCVTPDGKLGTNWAIATGCLHQGDIFGTLRFTVITVILLGMILLGFLFLVSIVFVLRSESADTIIIAIRTLTDIIAILSVFYTHHIQTIVLSALTGMYSATYFTNRVDAPWMACLMFFLFQIMSYVAFYGFILLTLPLVESLTARAPLVFLSAPLVYWGVFTVLREALISWLWETTANRLHSGPKERELFLSQWNNVSSSVIASKRLMGRMRP
jgi:hypothetical protein